MKKSFLKNKKSVRIISVMLLVLGMICSMFSGCKKEDGYRVIQVYEVNGNATIAREKVGSMDAYEKLNLISGDWLSVLKESYMRLKMDEDKYMLVEEESELSIFATGSDKNSKTDIQLEKGSITIEVQNKLGNEESFEVTTPNAVMAVRGTVFHVSAGIDENGEPITKVAIFEGTVTVQKIDKNGQISEEQIITGGKEVIIYEEEDGEVVILINDEIDIENYPPEVWEFLQEISESGRELWITSEEIEEKLEEAKAAESVTEITTEIAPETEIESESETETESETENASETERENETETTASTEQETPGNSGGTTGGGTGSTESTENTESTESTESTENTESTESTEDTQTQEFTVTFMYGDIVFGTQQVTAGQKATCPKLAPAPSGRWDFDFETAITEDTTIYFVTEE